MVFQSTYHSHLNNLLTVSQIPKPNDTEGLGIQWPATTGDMDKLKALCEDIKSKM